MDDLSRLRQGANTMDRGSCRDYVTISASECLLDEATRDLVPYPASRKTAARNDEKWQNVDVMDRHEFPGVDGGR